MIRLAPVVKRILTCVPITLCAFQIGFASENAGSPTAFKTIEFPDLEARLSYPHRLQVRGPGGAYGNRLITAYSSLTPIDIYRLPTGNIRMGILSPVLFGIGTFIPLAIGYPSIESMEFVQRNWLAFLLPGYMLNPELQVRLTGGARMFGGYSFNLVQEKRTRPVFAANAGLQVGNPWRLPDLRVGFERLFYRGEEVDCVIVGLTLRD